VGGNLSVEGWQELACSDVSVTATEVPSPTPDPDLGRCLAAAAPVSSSEFLRALGTVIHGNQTRSRLGRRAAVLLARLTATTQASDTPRMTRSARDLLGLGPGLTPGGDDVVAGWMSGLFASGPQGQATLRVIGSAVLQAAERLTNDISQAFLGATSQGHIAHPLRVFVAHPDPGNLDGVLRMGATSGGDWLAGYLLARHALPREPR
jgi:hypothetical protein